jgi:tetratricopeptide (TPR) repeat protein
MGDLDYFTKDADMDMALQYYIRAEQNGWSPPEMQYRMGSAYYHLQQWAQAQERFIAVADMIPYNRRILNSLGNVSYIQGDYFIAKAYYSRLIDILNADKERFHVLSPQTRDDHFTLAKRLMVAENNMGVTLETLTTRTGNPEYKKQALDYYINSSRAWDTLTRDPQTLVRAGMTDLTSPGVNLASLNSQNAFNPEVGYEPQIYVEIDKDVLEPSPWEALAPQNIRLSEPLR